MIDTVGKDEATHEHVPQQLTVTPIRAQAAELLALLKEVSIDTPNFKVRCALLCPLGYFESL